MHWLKIIITALIGGAAGYLYYRFIGCKTGACPLTSSPWVSTLYGAIIGALLSAQ